jgi:hypothetical protein
MRKILSIQQIREGPQKLANRKDKRNQFSLAKAWFVSPSSLSRGELLLWVLAIFLTGCFVGFTAVTILEWCGYY